MKAIICTKYGLPEVLKLKELLKPVPKDDEVLIKGAGGTIGTFAVQLAKNHGAEVIGVDSTRKLEMLREIGADHVIDYTQDDFIKRGK